MRSHLLSNYAIYLLDFGDIFVKLVVDDSNGPFALRVNSIRRVNHDRVHVSGPNGFFLFSRRRRILTHDTETDATGWLGRKPPWALRRVRIL